MPLVVFNPGSGSVEIGHDPLGDPVPGGLRVTRKSQGIGHSRTLVFDFSPAVVSSLKTASWMDLILGLTLMSMIAGYIAVEQRRRKAVEAVVSERTRDLAGINETLRDENEARQIAQADLLRTSDQLKVVIEASRQSALRLAAVVDNAVDGLINFDESGIVEAFNPACERMFGYGAAEVIGRSVNMLMPELPGGAHDGHISRHLATGETQAVGSTGREIIAKRKDGSTFPMNIAIGAFTLADGRHFCGIVRDISDRKRAEMALSASEARLRQFIDEAPPAMAMFDTAMCYLAVSRQFLKDYGLSDQTPMIGRSHYELFPEIPESWRIVHRRVLAGEKLSAEAEPFLRADGSTDWVRWEMAPWRDVDGAIGGAILFSEDMTDRKRSEANVALLAAIVASSDDAIMSKTTEGVITSWNAAAERLFGYPATEAIGQHIKLIVPPDLGRTTRTSTPRPAMAKLSSTSRPSGSTRMGATSSISASISPVHDKTGRVVGAAKVARDIPRRKRQESRLAHHVAALERSNEELDEFAYIASHDLKEPLRGLFNNAKFLHEDYAEKLDQEGSSRLLRLSYLSQRMERLVNDLLYFSRLGRQELAIQPTDLNDVIRDIETMSETILAERNATIVIPGTLPRISCDKTRIAEVFRNLITNAVKYNENEARRIEVGYLDEVTTKDGVERQVFYVKDNGIGIAEEFHEDIFRIFKRLNAEDDDKKGTGVGLTFVRKIVERHGGRIWLESVPGEGTTFYFNIDQGAAYAAAA